ncbi:hypothetical protein V8G54_030646 [Vigna mungo]|uniref:Uncharacterized protein n=1 Tax=Vigna mungo TaxID=3915 RepID=A0AAQ3MWK0_VIGMU
MTGDYYPNLVHVFYNNVKVFDGNVHSRVKGLDIVINNDTWLLVAGIKNEGRLSHLPDCLQNRWTRKTQMFKDCMSKILVLNGVNLNDENKVTCNKANQIGKTTLTCIGLKRTALGWIFSDVKKVFKRTNKMKRSLDDMNEKMDEIIKHYVENSTSTKESVREEVEETSEEDSAEMTETE